MHTLLQSTLGGCGAKKRQPFFSRPRKLGFSPLPRSSPTSPTQPPAQFQMTPIAPAVDVKPLHNGLFFTVSPLDASHRPPASLAHCPARASSDRSEYLIGESAGYAPKARIGTKLCVCMGLNLPGRDDDSMNGWRRSIQQRLGKEGFPEVFNAWTKRQRAAGDRRGMR